MPFPPRTPPLPPAPSAPPAPRTILHVDMDAFYASVEVLRRPELRGQPVVVGGRGARGVVAAASYEARAYGIHSAMPSLRARRLCPHAVFVDGDHAHYAAVSRRVMDLFLEYTPLVEPLSLDEAFLDVTGSGRLHGTGVQVARAIRQRVIDQESLTCSVGVATNKMLAKLASEAAKPRATRQGPRYTSGIHVVPPGTELDFLHPLPVGRLWGVGPATLTKLERLGVRTVGDLANVAEERVVATLGDANGSHLWRLAHAVDDRPVVPDQQPKSIGHEETFATDHRSLDTLRREAVRMADAVASRLRHHHLVGRTVTLKVRFHDFRTITRSITLPNAVDSGTVVARSAKGLLDQIDPGDGVRLLGVSVSGLSAATARQLSLDDVEEPAWVEADGAIDEIRRRFGDGAIGLAASAGADGLRVKRRGDQQWGPGAAPADALGGSEPGPNG